MNPEIVERSKLLLVGVTASGKSVADIDICALWNVFSKSEVFIPERVKGGWYELHVGSGIGKGIYSVTAGVEVSACEELPVELCLKVVPAGNYVHYAHTMRDGDGYPDVDTYRDQEFYILAKH